MTADLKVTNLKKEHLTVKSSVHKFKKRLCTISECCCKVIEDYLESRSFILEKQSDKEVNKFTLKPLELLSLMRLRGTSTISVPYMFKIFSNKARYCALFKNRCCILTEPIPYIKIARYFSLKSNAKGINKLL